MMNYLLINFITGSSLEYASDILSIPYVYQINLADGYHQNGYLLPSQKIKSTSIEIWQGVKALAKNL